MERGLPAPTMRLFRRKTCIFMPAFVEELVRTIRQIAPHECRDGINHLPKFGFRLLDFIKRISEGLLRPLALDPLRDRVGNRCERVENGFRKWATREQRHHSDQPILDKQWVSGEGNHSVILCPTLIMHAWIVRYVISQMRLLLPGNPADLQVSNGDPAV